jgi:uncharacterized protein YheU (UPF0270 family)
VTDYIEIPPQQLSVEVLDALIEEYITREGTDYGDVEYSLEQKLTQVKRQLANGQAMIVFDPVTESCTLISKQ